MALGGNSARNGNCNINDGITSETALDWFHRSQGYSKSDNKKRRRCNISSLWNDDPSSDNSDVNAATDPSMAAWRFLRFGKSGIAPIDAAWKRNHKVGPGLRGQPHSRPPSFLPPVTVLEGPKDVGKTWMLLTLAARFVVATRASRFKEFEHCGDDKSKDVEATNRRQNEDSKSGRDSDSEDTDEDGSNDDEPKVLLLDSTYDFTVPQLVNVVRSTLERDRQRQRTRAINQRERQSQGQQQNVPNNEVIDTTMGYSEAEQNQYQQKQRRKIEDELERQERERISLEQDLEDCLSRIHVIQVDNGPTGWVPILEALSYQLSEGRRRRNEHTKTQSSFRSRDIENSPAGPPTLLLWDGFLSDMALPSNAMMTPAAPVVIGDNISNFHSSQALFESPGVQELLMQLSRLLQKEPDALWLVLTTRTISVEKAASTNDAASDVHTPATTEHSGIGLRLTEWVRKEEERRRREKDSEFVREGQPRNRYPNRQPTTHSQRASHRIRLDRRHGSRIPGTAAEALALFARIVGGSAASFDPIDGTNRNNSFANDEKIPYSISLGGILS